METMAYPFKNLIFEGRGVKGIAYVGALNELKKERQFRKGLQNAVIAIGDLLLENREQMATFLEQPVNGGQPRTIMSKAEAVEPPLEKSEGPRFQASRGDVSRMLTGMLEKGEINNPLIIAGYESTGELPEDVQKLVEQRLVAAQAQ